MSEKYTGPRRCDLCKYKKDAPCPGKGCNSVNRLKNFEPKGVPKEGAPKWSIDSFSYHKKEDRMVFHLESESEGTILVELSPDEIADFAYNH